VVYDGGGWIGLRRWPQAWPVERGLAEGGTTYTNATIGSAPAVTAAIHATMGTGQYPRQHGLSENVGRLPDGRVGEIYLDRGDPRLLEGETLPDAWDRANGNSPWTGLLGYESWHLGMMGKGARAEGGDRDAAVLWDPEGSRFWVNEEFYRLPEYLPGDEVLARYVDELDASDRTSNGAWMDNDLSDPEVVASSPALIRYQRDAVLEMLAREPVGQDGLTDFLFLELKQTDSGAHIWNMEGPEHRVVLRTKDRTVGDVLATLDRRVGRGSYVLAMTADHGLTPLPETSGGLRIHPDVLGRRIDEYFGAAIVEKVTPSGIFLDRRALRERGILLEAVARFVGGIRFRDVLPNDLNPSEVPRELLDRPVIAGALPGAFVVRLDENEVQALGESAFPEGDLTSPDHPFSTVLHR
jgi:predicted AlkP superfamily pyrophosphatase or phosphodiesterase